MALTERSIVTLDEAKDYLGINRANSDFDDPLESFIDIVSGDIEERIGNKVAMQDVELILDGSGESIQRLPWSIVGLVGADEATQLANLQYRDGAGEDWEDIAEDMDYVVIDDTKPWQIEVLTSDADLSVPNIFPRGARNIRIEYTAGFDPLPASIRKVCLEMLGVMWKESGKGEGRVGLQTFGTGQAGGSQSGSYLDMESRWKIALRPYMKLRPNVTVLDI